MCTLALQGIGIKHQCQFLKQTDTLSAATRKKNSEETNITLAEYVLPIDAKVYKTRPEVEQLTKNKQYGRGLSV